MNPCNRSMCDLRAASMACWPSPVGTPCCSHVFNSRGSNHAFRIRCEPRPAGSPCGCTCGRLHGGRARWCCCALCPCYRSCRGTCRMAASRPAQARRAPLLVASPTGAVAPPMPLQGGIRGTIAHYRPLWASPLELRHGYCHHLSLRTDPQSLNLGLHALRQWVHRNHHLQHRSDPACSRGLGRPASVWGDDALLAPLESGALYAPDVGAYGAPSARLTPLAASL